MSSPLAEAHWAIHRRHELDWLRVLAFGLLIVYHLGMAYVADWGWHIKSTYESKTLQYLMLWSNQWRMPLLFLISGAALSYQLHHYSGWGVVRARGGKLLLPLAFGSLVVVAPQAFVESKMADAIPDMTYLEFWRHYVGYPWGFGEPLPAAYGRFDDANVIWNHLWYLPYLFAYVLALWSLYPLLHQPAISRTAETLAQSLPLALLYLAPVGLIFGIGQWLWERFPTTHKLVDDWHNHARYFMIFVLGFALVRNHRLWRGLMQMRHLSLALAIGSYGGICFYVGGDKIADYLPVFAVIENPLRGLVWSANLWLWIMAILGYAQVWLNRPSPLIRTANHAVYCWYILHQTFIVLGIYWLRNYQLGPALEPLAVGSLTVIGCGLGYALIKRVPVLRGLIGIFASRDGFQKRWPPQKLC